MNKNNQISKNFTVEEFTYSRKAIENGIDNMPGESQIAAIRLLITQLIQPLRDRLGEPIAITSGYRCPEVNRLVGGVVNSQHTRGVRSSDRVQEKEILALVLQKWSEQETNN